MKILILDDDKTRHERFAQWFAGYDVTHALTFFHFRAAIWRERFDVVFLDHDLEMYPGNESFSGMDAAHVVASLSPELMPDRVIVHSWNPVGARDMALHMLDHGVNVNICRFDPKMDAAFMQIVATGGKR